MDALKKYEPIKLPDRSGENINRTEKIAKHIFATPNISFEQQKFAEIEINSSENKLASQMIPNPRPFEPITDEIYKVYMSMRRISHNEMNSARLFYRQAEFMKDFEDNFTEQAEFSAYYPHYIMLSYEQFRTYFTWRTNIRKGIIANISLSYAFVYIYELLSNIGVKDPQDGLNKLITFWKSFREFDNTIDKYLYDWVKDYHVYYGLHQTFKDFAEKQNIYMHYPQLFCYDSDINNSFELFCKISTYKIKRSAFYNEKTWKLINDCFYFVIKKYRQIFNEKGMCFEDLLFQSTSGTYDWKPFRSATFYPWDHQTNKVVKISRNEIYVCKQNVWSCKSVLNVTRGKILVGYIMKKMESILRKKNNFKHRISVNQNMLDETFIGEIGMTVTFLDNLINDAVSEYYTETNRVIISVDCTNLEKIRKDAQNIQEKLIVQQDDVDKFIKKNEVIIKSTLVDKQPVKVDSSNIWMNFKQSLSKTEIEALKIILQEQNLRVFSDSNGLMLEVLIEKINEKACDSINDNVLESDSGNSVNVYDDYKEKLIEMVVD